MVGLVQRSQRHSETHYATEARTDRPSIKNARA